ncbi:hypothetical protein KUCAC02_032025, partial [Chaenocephalus aceratus]
VPRVLQSRFSLPLALVCVPSSPAKTTTFKITVDTNQPPVDLSVLFPEFSTKSEDKEANSLAFQFLAGAKVTVVASKTSQRYRIQSDRFEDTWLVVNALVQRFDQHFSTLGVHDFKKSFSGPLPLQEYFLSVDHHFQQYQDLLSERAVQFRAIQRRLLTRFKDKTPAPLQNLDTLIPISGILIDDFLVKNLPQVMGGDFPLVSGVVCVSTCSVRDKRNGLP